MRKTHALIQVLMVLLDDPAGPHWGYELSKQTGVRSGALYPILTRMLNEGWVKDGWEDPTTIRDKRPPRRYYQVTDKGQLALSAVLQEARRDARFAGLIGRFAEPSGGHQPSMTVSASLIDQTWINGQRRVLTAR